MTSVDLVVKNGTIVTGRSSFTGALAVRDGKIVFVGSNESLPNADRVVDAAGLYVLPGVIDVHVHLRDPGYTYKEDFGSGTAAAAAGGVTCVFDMPNNSPPTKNVEALNAKVEAAEAKAVVDYCLYGLLTVDSLPEVEPLSRAGVIGYKLFMGETTGKIVPPSDGELSDQFSEVSKLGLRVAVHAEDDPAIQSRVRTLRTQGRTDAHAHFESRPSVVEEEAVQKAISYATEAKCDLHISHLSSRWGTVAVQRARTDRASVSAETCPHYLILDDRRYSEIGPLMKINPSIKTAEDQASLWDAIRTGTIEMIASDHSPHVLEEKTKPVIFDCASGFPGLETSVPLILTQVNRGTITLNKYVQLTSENPAKIWKLSPKKGSLSVGSDADFTIVDMKARAKIDSSRFYSKAKWSPFDGFEVEGMPVYTIVRGNIVMDHGAVTEEHAGMMVQPAKPTAN
ncbi:MAG: dihydroorotase family protein [Nitrososphaerales archaeon]|nr:dihydroorotase family protein [Nitrososphaerales archaeon]